jgi:methylated-DNA-[protein]-cysteine S-methyltransferase
MEDTVDDTTRTAILSSPLGDLLLTTRHGGLVAVDLMEASLGCDPGDVRGTRAPGPAGRQDTLLEARRQLEAYFVGRLQAFALPLSPRGTPFQLQVWEALRAIPYGATVSYSELARRIGRPSAARAVGRAVGQNPLAIVVPCHRVVGANGTLTGFAWGIERKRRLLELEASVAHAGHR